MTPQFFVPYGLLAYVYVKVRLLAIASRFLHLLFHNPYESRANFRTEALALALIPWVSTFEVGLYLYID